VPRIAEAHHRLVEDQDIAEQLRVETAMHKRVAQPEAEDSAYSARPNLK
jgi:hypothetical protein